MVVTLGACRYTPPEQAADGDVGDPVPDAGECRLIGTECASPSTLRTCASLGGTAIDTTCDWGCVAATPAHCGVLVPTGGGVLPTDLDPNGVADIDLAGGVIDVDDGSISGLRGAGEGIVDGIEYQIRSGIAVFRFKSLHVGARLSIVGGVPVALVAAKSVIVDDVIDVRGPCGDGAGRTPGPGGFTGGATDVSAAGSGAGAGNNGNGDGGGGGGYGGSGGGGASGQAGGAVFGDPVISTLVGGGGGGGGKNNAGGGGGGGGAIQLASNAEIVIGATGGINAGGCGGSEGNGGPNDAGGGGGAGGTILLEAPRVVIAGSVAVNGGGGGGRVGGTDGTGGRIDRTAAVGGGNGGAGGAGAAIDGTAAAGGGGGGGGVGRIRIQTRAGTATITGSISPNLVEVPTTATEGTAAVQ